MFKNSNTQGNAGLGAAIAHFTSLGYVVAVPLTDSQPYDLVIDDGSLKRVQVKTTSSLRNDRFVVELRVKGGNRSGVGKIKKFSANDAEWLFVLTSSGLRYLIPSHAIGGTTISLGPTYSKYIVNGPTWESNPSGIHPTYITPPDLQSGVGDAARTATSEGIEPPPIELETSVLPLHHEVVISNANPFQESSQLLQARG